MINQNPCNEKYITNFGNVNTSPSEFPPISKEVVKLEESVKSLKCDLEDLKSRISPILNFNVMNKDCSQNGNPKPVKSELASRLEDINIGVGELKQILTDIFSRIEL